MVWRQKQLVLAMAALMTLVCVCSAQAQGRRGQGQNQPGGPPPGGFQGGPGGFGGMMGGFGRGASELALLGREEVQKELVLVDDQLSQLEELRDNNDMRAMFEKLRDLPQEERMAKGRELMEASQKKTQQQIDEILLPHQADRLKQLVHQFQLRGGGGLASEEVGEKLGISEEQREKLRTKARELEQQLRKKLVDDLLKELTPEQQAKYKELVGEPFEFQQDERMGPGGRGPGAPGGRGGNPGGRRDRGN
ncbi:MAG: hypothetical protein ACYC0X_30185 [Pirellulaceae bacterium]